MRTFADYDAEPRDAVPFKNCACIRESPKAILVRLEDGREKWIPQSVVHADSEVYAKGHVGTLIVRAWFAEKMR